MQPRHLNAIYPAACHAGLAGGAAAGAPRAGPRSPEPRRLGARCSCRCADRGPKRRAGNLDITRRDSRLVSYRWIVANLPRNERILLDDYGPPLQPNPASVARQQAILKSLPKGPFTHHQGKRLELLRQLPVGGRHGHRRARPSLVAAAGEVRCGAAEQPGRPRHGQPADQPPAEAARGVPAEGVRFLVTNSEARGKYFGNRRQMGQNFPSFLRFYAEIAASRPFRTFDPAQWGGKGPVIWLYDLASPVRTIREENRETHDHHQRRRFRLHRRAPQERQHLAAEPDEPAPGHPGAHGNQPVPPGLERAGPGPPHRAAVLPDAVERRGATW